MKKLAKIYEYFIYLLPAVLFFSYYPILSLGGNDGSMNLELSLPLIWLALFDVFSFVLLFAKIKIGKKYPGISDRRFFLFSLFPFFATLSIFWSKNPLRATLTAGIIWLVFFAIFSIIYLSKFVVETIDKALIKKSLIVSSLVISAWCLVQCILDVFGCSSDVTLLCPGCTVQMFGFPHPNGFAIEPQFMGNLLLAPALYELYEFIKNRKAKDGILLFIFAATLFLTFSRGAVYAFGLAAIVMLVWYIIKTKKAAAIKSLIILAAAFIFTLNLQGIFAAASYTNDTYFTGVAKVVEQLSLGIIKLNKAPAAEPAESTEPAEPTAPEAEKPLENQSLYSGYVTESTDVRLHLSDAAGEIWSKNPRFLARGVGLGGAGVALFENGKVASSKEIVQNEYFSILLELGLIGLGLLVLIIVFAVRMLSRQPDKIFFFSLMIAYGVTLCFFSGLPNALQIYLMPALFLLVLANHEKLPKKV